MRSFLFHCNLTSQSDGRVSLSRRGWLGVRVDSRIAMSVALTAAISGGHCVLLSSSASADPVCVISERANMRKGPGSSFPISWEVGQHMPLDRVGKKGGWVQVKDLDGETHWISSSSISGRVNCVVVRTKMASLHSSAGARAPASDLAFADRYTPFKKVDRDDAWIQVEDDHGVKYWINETNVWMPVMHSRVEF